MDETNITSAGFAIQGAKQFQEDSWFSWSAHDDTGVVVVGGVYDGHGGKMGKVASETCRDHSLEMFTANKTKCTGWGPGQWHQFLSELFDSMHNRIRQKFLETPQRSIKDTDEYGVVRKDDSGADPVHGGTTGTIVVMFRHGDEYYLITANVGDSTAVLCHRRQKKFEFLTTDHGPESQAEWRRVHNDKTLKDKLLFVYDKTNVYRKYELPRVFGADGIKDQRFVRNPWGMGLHPTNVRYEPAVYAVSPGNIFQDATCIAMTRSLGDFYGHQFGLTHVPTIACRKLNPEIVPAPEGDVSCPLSPPHPSASPPSPSSPSPSPSSSSSSSSSSSRSNNVSDSGKAENTPAKRVKKDGDTGDDNSCDLYLQSGEFSIFVGSDGIWDCWKYEDFTEFANDCFDKHTNDIAKVTLVVTEESIVRAKANFGADFDDACLVGWQFKIPPKKQ